MYHHRHRIPRVHLLATLAALLAVAIIVTTADVAGAAGLEWHSVAQFETSDEPPLGRIIGRLIGFTVPVGLGVWWVVRTVRRRRDGQV